MIRKTYLLFDKASGNPLHTVDLNTNISDLSYNDADVWAILNTHRSATAIKANMGDPTVNGLVRYEVDRTDSDFIAKGIFAFHYNTTSHQVEKVTPG